MPHRALVTSFSHVLRIALNLPRDKFPPGIPTFDEPRLLSGRPDRCAKAVPLHLSCTPRFLSSFLMFPFLILKLREIKRVSDGDVAAE